MTDLILGIAIGYIVCVVVPLPFVNRFILDKWAALGAWIKSKR